MNKQNLRFEYKDEEFSANNMAHAYTRFLDEAWGTQYVNYLESQGLKNVSIYAVEDLEEVEEDGYYRLIQKLENESILKFEVWKNENGYYRGLCSEVKDSDE